MIEFFVSPAGDDFASGDEANPFATLERAAQAAGKERGDVLVHLRAGVHRLTGTFRLTGQEAGGTRTIVVQAYGHGSDQPESVTVSGGLVLTDWEQRDGVWLADIGDLDTRELYVDGRRIERAGIDAIPGEVSKTETSYRVVGWENPDWRAPGSVEFVYRGIYPWTEARCPVASLTHDGETVTIEMRQPAFGRAQTLYNFAWEGEVLAGPGLPTRVENDPAFLTEPGTFVLDRTRPGHHVLHYRPRAGEDPATTTVVLPVLENLVSVDGAREVTFRGVTFADTTWCGPHGEDGFLHYHGSGHYRGGPVEKVLIVEDQAWVTVPGEVATVPAGVTVDDSAAVRFERCRFVRMGASALAIRRGVDVTVAECEVEMVGGSAVQINDSRNVLVENTDIRHIGLEYSGCPAVSLLETVDCIIQQNRISEVPHNGVVAGAGKGTRILRNLIAGSMSVLADGGGIYLTGTQGDSAENGALVEGNVVRDTRTPYNFALYADYGASWVTFERNVVLGADNTASLQVSPPLENVTFRENIWEADPIGVDAIPDTVVLEGNITIVDPAKLEKASEAIQRAAGPRSGVPKIDVHTAT